MNNCLKYAFRYAFRDNPFIEKKTNFFISFPWLDPNKQTSIHNRLLKRSLAHAVKKIPFYKEFVPSKEIYQDGFKALNNFPVISKTDLLSKRQELYPAFGIKKAWWSLGKTSGTTGSPLEIFRSYNSVLYENAFVRRHWSWAGFKRHMRRATLRGDVIVPIEKKFPPYWYQNNYDNQLLISSRHLHKNAFPSILEKLRKFAPYLLEAYPSTAYEVAKHLEREGLYIETPYIFTSSEILYDHQRALIEDRFRCKVMDFYGMAERVAFASECEFGNLHINTDYSFVEILDENNEPTDGYGNITGTTFHNLAMPLIRYKLSDITKWKKGSCPCGRTFPMIEPIQGKFEDTLFGGNGNPISPSVLTFAFKGLKKIIKSQVVQIAESEWEIRIVPENGFSNVESELLAHNIKKLVDAQIKVTIKKVPEIKRTESGKYRWVVNEWKTKS